MRTHPDTRTRLGWHFLASNNRLGYADNRVVQVGKWYEMRGSGKPELCERGMHAGRTVIDALKYAPGPILDRVEVQGDIAQDGHKFCGRRRRTLWRIDAEAILHEFACRCAEDALALVANPDPRSLAAVKAKREWLRGNITDDQLVASRDAARDAAWDAARARDAAWDVAWDVAWDAAWARAAAGDAARAAAGIVAWEAARVAAWEAARVAAGTVAWEAARGAAAAWAAAGTVARKRQNHRLTAMVCAARRDASRP